MEAGASIAPPPAAATHGHTGEGGLDLCNYKTKSYIVRFWLVYDHCDKVNLHLPLLRP